MTNESEATATLTVLRPGLRTTVVDLGRPHCRSLGVPVGGAAHRASLVLGNALVGNPPGAAALEVTLAGPTLAADAPLACVLFGAPFELATDRRSLVPGMTFTLAAGEELRIGGTRERLRAYLCVSGGLLTPVVLGSRSGLEAIRQGTKLSCRSAAREGRWLGHPYPTEAGGRVLRALPGRQSALFASEGFYSRGFTVARESDRMGLRLRGEPLAPPPGELVSEPVCPGSVQVTRDGQCIVLGVDGQTIGGYPKIAQVISADLDKLAQLRPGEELRFQRVTLDAAEEAYRQKQAELAEWLLRLQVTAASR
jgi:antagonist of KipI